jgi:hypothetical protein
MQRREVLRAGLLLAVAGLGACRRADAPVSEPVATPPRPRPPDPADARRGDGGGPGTSAVPEGGAERGPPQRPTREPTTPEGADTDEATSAADPEAPEADTDDASDPSGDSPPEGDGPPTDVDDDVAAGRARIEVVCRDALGLVAASAGGRPHAPSRMTLHHTAVPLDRVADAPGRLRGHQRFHQQQGWSDIAYHYAVDLAGNAYELRDPSLAGDTFTDYDPAGHWLVVCEGDYDRQQPTDAMLETVAALFADAATTHGIEVATLGGHRDHAATSCPGDALHARLGPLRTRVTELVADGPGGIALLCGGPGDERIAAIEAGRTG